MNDYVWSVNDQPEQQDIGFLQDCIYEYNAARTGYTDGRLLSIFVRDASGAIVAGLYGWTWGGCLQIEDSVGQRAATWTRLWYSTVALCRARRASAWLHAGPTNDS